MYIELEEQIYRCIEEHLMAANTGNNKRTAVRHVRDGIKSNYNKESECACCGTTEALELHHYTTLSTLLKKYSKEKGLPISTDEEVLAMRDQFYEDHWYELVDYTVTLCNSHHVELHRIYGREPALTSSEKQENWVKKIHGRLSGKDADLIPEATVSNRFSRHI